MVPLTDYVLSQVLFYSSVVTLDQHGRTSYYVKYYYYSRI